MHVTKCVPEPYWWTPEDKCLYLWLFCLARSSSITLEPSRAALEPGALRVALSYLSRIAEAKSAVAY